MSSQGIYSIILLAITTVLFSACVTTQDRTTITKKKNEKFLLKKIEKNKINFDWVGIKSKLKFATEEQKLSVSASIRMKKDSIIWIKVSKAGIEGARIQISPQTIEILNRQESTYTRRAFSMIKDEYGLEISFGELQDLLIGNPILYQNKTLVASIEENKNVLKTKSTEKEVLKIFFENVSFLLSEMRGSTNNNAMRIVYGEYEKVENATIPFLKNIEIDSETNGLVSLKMIFTKVELNQIQKVRFSIPDSYQKE